MRRVRRSRTPLLLAALLIPILLGGCISTQTDVTLRNDGSGTLSLVYVIDRSAWDTGVFDGSDRARPVPVSREEFQNSADQIEGISLSSYRMSEDDQHVMIDAGVAFASIESLQRFLGANSLSVSLSADGGSWSQTIAPAAPAPTDQSATLADDLAGYDLRFSLTPPRPVVQTNGTTEAGGKRAAFEVTLSDVMTTQSPIVWEVRW